MQILLNFGLVSNLSKVKLANHDTIWNSDSEILGLEKPVHLFWGNEDRVEFLVTITVDENYLFTIEQTIVNNSDKELPVQSYGLINLKYIAVEKAVYILLQGHVGCIDENLKEYSYVMSSCNVPMGPLM